MKEEFLFYLTMKRREKKKRKRHCFLGQICNIIIIPEPLKSIKISTELARNIKLILRIIIIIIILRDEKKNIVSVNVHIFKCNPSFHKLNGI